VDVLNVSALEQAVKSAGRLKGLAYAVGSINLKPLKATTTDDFVQVRWMDRPVYCLLCLLCAMVVARGLTVGSTI
jgi:hypothetical protein